MTLRSIFGEQQGHNLNQVMTKSYKNKKKNKEKDYNVREQSKKS